MINSRSALFLTALLILFGCSKSEMPTISVMQEVLIADQIESLPPKQYITYAFTVVPEKMIDPFLHANVVASGGLVSAINILVLTDHQFDRWRAVNNVQYTPVAETGFLREAKIAIPLNEPGVYRLVLSNKTSDEALQVSVSATLNFDTP